METNAAGRAANGQADEARDAPILGGITLGVLSAAFPHWRIVERSGLWWALRGGSVSMEGPESLLRTAITAQDLARLAEKLCLQEHLDRLDPGELATVYRDMTLPLPAPEAAG
jgi:hypothetical protein